MQIRLEQIADEPFRWEESPPISHASLARPEVLGLGPIAWSGMVTRELAGYRLTARLSYEQTLACTRCLAPLVAVVDEEIELMIQVRSPEPVLGEHELRASDLRTLFLEDDLLDTTPILMEQLQLNVPMKPLCRDDCAGLCPHCGADRNQAPCSCAETEVDPRWQVLRQWRGGDPDPKRG